MNMTVTESDKKLLSFLAAFLLAIAFIFFVFRPLTEKNKALEKEISEAKQQEISIDMSASLSEDMSQTEQAVREQIHYLKEGITTVEEVLKVAYYEE